LVADLERTADLMEQIIAQTWQRLSGETPDSATRVVSLHDADARPIRKGRKISNIVDYSQRIILVCNEGYSSSLAAATLQDLGLYRATDLVGGFQGWPTLRSCGDA
jgi:rhodanese-related sulfurtransferase